jgi:4-amino-4-deoxy-L-arabinose transferase-like glycosyltransferase
MPSEKAGWLPGALGWVGAVTALRLVLLAFNRTDLFVDESQYWLWGQEFAFGYFSKPPLIGWVIGAVTGLVGSDAQFWVRAPGAVFHAATALLLAAFTARRFGNRAAIWVAAAYVTTPFAAFGSLIISTDTIMAPLFAAALLFHARLVDEGRMRDAVLAGVMVGLACMAKYAGVYFLIGIALAALIDPAMRLRPRAVLALLLAFGVVVLPNVVWNLNNGLVTLSHTMDNVAWVREPAPMQGLNPVELLTFFAAQFAVFGPILFGTFLYAIATGWRGPYRSLIAQSLPILAVVCVQALLSRAYANWAVATYFAATVLVVPLLLQRAPRLLWASMVLNCAVALALPLLTLWPETPRPSGRPLLARYIGRADVTTQILQAAKDAGDVVVVSDTRDVLADLFYRVGQGGPAIYATPARGRPDSFYQQRHALPDTGTGMVLYVATRAPICAGTRAPVFRSIDTAGGAYEKFTLDAYLIPMECLNARN